MVREETCGGGHFRGAVAGARSPAICADAFLEQLIDPLILTFHLLGCRGIVGRKVISRLRHRILLKGLFGGYDDLAVANRRLAGILSLG
ncbi:hypothetical protein [Microvirga calopogonii]|uniref:hypothetical protein n=1 Tax=Microvirga calopogonii TaxID=2078013 RepID=UPI0013B411E7|nr:hypothetical protein [Microvirga calopogonii]